MASDDRKRAYWRRTQRITLILLALWFAVTVGIGYFARELQFPFFGWPFSFWAAAQGALVVYVLIIAVYAWVMNRLDRAHQALPPGEGDGA
jgi:putative solute:sodium symporter small subunit